MTSYDHRVMVRVTGTRDGWSRTLVDTPAFELRSNAQFGGVWKQADAVLVARNMFANLLQAGDVMRIDISDLDGANHTSHTFGA